MRHIFSVLLCCLLLFTSHSRADFSPNEPNLYPAGFPTAELLRHDEWYLADPFHGWVAYGATPWLTVAWDWPATLFGHPAGLMRFGLTDVKSTSLLALEIYGISWAPDFEQKRSDDYLVYYKGSQDWARLNFTQKFSKDFRAHVYAGATYTDFYSSRPNKSKQFPTKDYSNNWSPDFGLDLEFRLGEKVYLHLNGTSGNTFLFVDQVLYKQVAAATFQLAPFSKDSVGILRNFRLEMTALWVKIPDVQYEYTLPLPLFPYAYWQWNGE